MRMRLGFFLAAMMLIWLVLTRTGDIHADEGTAPETVMAASMN